MHALIVVAHPLQDSLTQAVAAQLAQGIDAASSTDSWEIADLISEGFDPRFNREDLALFRGDHDPAADIAAEQTRVARADALVLVYPLYWWSFRRCSKAGSTGSSATAEPTKTRMAPW